MTTRITADETSAIGVEAPNGRARPDRAAESWFADLVKALWPVKGPAAVQQYTRCPDRTARAYASGHREPPASVLRDLLRGDEGYRVLSWVMCGSTVTWWLVIQQERRVAEAARDVYRQLAGIIQ